MRTVGELRAALDGVPDDAEWLICVDADVVPVVPPSDGDPQPVGSVLVDPGATRAVQVLRPGEDGWPFDLDDPAPAALAYLMVGEWP